jgi:hypothetical protein
MMPGKIILRGMDEVSAWYKGSGETATTDKQLEMAVALLPGLGRVISIPDSVVVDTCCTTHTPTKQLYMGEVRCAFSTEVPTRGCHWFPRLLA